MNSLYFVLLHTQPGTMVAVVLPLLAGVALRMAAGRLVRSLSRAGAFASRPERS